MLRYYIFSYKKSSSAEKNISLKRQVKKYGGPVPNSQTLFSDA